jgi:hypothetical protein
MSAILRAAQLHKPRTAKPRTRIAPHPFGALGHKMKDHVEERQLKLALGPALAALSFFMG